MISTYRLRTFAKVLFFIILVIVNSGYMMQVSTGTAQTFIQYSTIIVFLLLAFYHFIVKRKIEKSGYNQNIFLMFTVIALISMFVNGEQLTLYINQIAIVFIAFYIVDNYNENRIAEIYVRTMVLISVISLLFLIWIKLFGIPTPISMISTTATENECYNYVIYFYPQLWDASLGRNRGVFWEPGLFATFIIIALVLEVLFAERISKLRVTILVITVISTFSTAGILLLIPTAIVYIDRLSEKSKKQTFILMLLWAVLILMVLYKDTLINALVSINSDIFGKLLGENNSKVTRLGAPLLNWEIFLSHPIFGAGIGGATTLFQQSKLQFLADSQTSTSLFMLAAFGILGILYTVWWIMSILGQKSCSITSRVSLLFIIFAILNKEPHIAILATWLLLFLFEKTRHSTSLDGIRPLTKGKLGKR